MITFNGCVDAETNHVVFSIDGNELRVPVFDYKRALSFGKPRELTNLICWKVESDELYISKEDLADFLEIDEPNFQAFMFLAIRAKIARTSLKVCAAGHQLSGLLENAEAYEKTLAKLRQFEEAWEDACEQFSSFETNARLAPFKDSIIEIFRIRNLLLKEKPRVNPAHFFIFPLSYDIKIILKMNCDDLIAIGIDQGKIAFVLDSSNFDRDHSFFGDVQFLDNGNVKFKLTDYEIEMKAISSLNPLFANEFVNWVYSEEHIPFVYLKVDDYCFHIALSHLADVLGVDELDIRVAEKQKEFKRFVFLALRARNAKTTLKACAGEHSLAKLFDKEVLEVILKNIKTFENAKQTAEIQCEESLILIKNLINFHIHNNTYMRQLLKMKEKITEIFRLRCLILERNKSTSPNTLAQFIPLDSNVHIIAKVINDEIDLIGLFGKIIHKGIYSKVIVPISLMHTEIPMYDNDLVLKFPKKNNEFFIEECNNEVKILNLLNANGPKLGIPSVMWSTSNCDCLATEKHAMSLYDFFLTKRRSQDLSLVFQLFHGLSWVHKLNIVHGDLKPENILIDPDPELGFRLYIIDFAGAAHFKTKNSQASPAFTNALYSHHNDRIMRKTENVNDLTFYLAYDVFACCAITCEIFNDRLPYTTDYSDKHTMDWSFQGLLLKQNLSRKTIDFLSAGLGSNYFSRPSAQTILGCIFEDIKRLNPRLASKLTIEI